MQELHVAGIVTGDEFAQALLLRILEWVSCSAREPLTPEASALAPTGFVSATIARRGECGVGRDSVGETRGALIADVSGDSLRMNGDIAWVGLAGIFAQPMYRRSA